MSLLAAILAPALASSPSAAPDSQQLGGVAGWAVGLMESIGAPGAGLAIALENLFPPLPSEVILPLAGFTAANGGFSVIEAIVWTTIGSVVGALALYLVGAAIGRQRMLAVADRMPLVDVEDVLKTERWFHRHGSKAIFFGRFIPIFRSLISIPAGIERTPLGLFTLLTAAGSAIWNTLFILCGYYLGENWHVVERYMGVFQKIVIAAVLAFAAWYLWSKLSQRRAAR